MPATETTANRESSSAPATEDPEVTNIERELGRMDAEIRQTRRQQDEDRTYFRGELATIKANLHTQDGKLDSLLQSQEVAARVRSRLEENADKRSKYTARWTGFFSGIIIVIVGEVVRWGLFHFFGVGLLR